VISTSRLNTRRSQKIALLGLAVAIAGLATVEGAQARGRGYSDGPGYVVAESRYGKGSVEGAVRYGRVGPEVQLPGGNWIGCERSCSETLRRATVDFWESNGPQSKDNGPGYFSWGWGYRR
jgi:hypothetical protein